MIPTGSLSYSIYIDSCTALLQNCQMFLLIDTPTVAKNKTMNKTSLLKLAVMRE